MEVLTTIDLTQEELLRTGGGNTGYLPGGCTPVLIIGPATPPQPWYDPSIL